MDFEGIWESDLIVSQIGLAVSKEGIQQVECVLQVAPTT
jgi:hypothetical protein